MTGLLAHPLISHALLRLFTELTGLRLAVLLAPPPGIAWDVRRLIAGCRSHGRRGRHGVGGAHCWTCSRTHLDRALATSGLGHCFHGACGARSFLIPVIKNSGPSGVLVLRDDPGGGRERSADPAGLPDRGAGFSRSVRLLRVLARDLGLRNAASDRASEVARLAQAVASHEKEEVWLRHALAHTVPGIRRSPAKELPAPGPRGARSRQIVLILVERMQREFAQPLSMARVAEEFGMNASHLSSAFTLVVGMPFKSYLTALRLQRGQALLSDPRRGISDIASEVGYASPDRFRAAFRAWTGLSPRRWRESFKIRSEN